MPVKLYHTLGSPPCNSVQLLAKTMGLDFNLKFIDFVKEEQKSPEYSKVNPLCTVPAIDDNGFIVVESRVILGYLVDQHGKNDSLYPKDIKKRTLVNQRLYFDATSLYQSLADYYYPVFSTGKNGDPAKLTKLGEAFQILNKYLDGQKWVAGDSLTIADFSTVSSVASAEALGFDINKYPNVLKWYGTAKKLPGYAEVVEEGVKILKEYYDSFKK